MTVNQILLDTSELPEIAIEIRSRVPNDWYYLQIAPIFCSWVAKCYNSAKTAYSKIRETLPKEDATKFIAWCKTLNTSALTTRHIWRGVYWLARGETYYGQLSHPEGYDPSSGLNPRPCRYPKGTDIAYGLMEGHCVSCKRRPEDVDPDWGCAGKPSPLPEGTAEWVWSNLRAEDQERIIEASMVGTEPVITPDMVKQGVDPKAPWLPLIDPLVCSNIIQDLEPRISKVVNSAHGSVGKQAGGLSYIIKNDARTSAEDFVGQLTLVVLLAVHRYEWRRESQTAKIEKVRGNPYGESHIRNTAWLLINNKIRDIQNRYTGEEDARIVESSEEGREYKNQFLSIEGSANSDDTASLSDVLGYDDKGYSEIEDENLLAKIKETVKGHELEVAGVLLGFKLPPNYVMWLNQEFGMNGDDLLKTPFDTQLIYASDYYQSSPSDLRKTLSNVAKSIGGV